MATDGSELDSFNHFVNVHLGGLNGKSLEDAIAEYRAYQNELDDARAKLAVAAEQSSRGESRELNDDDFWMRVDKRLDDKGVPE